MLTGVFGWCGFRIVNQDFLEKHSRIDNSLACHGNKGKSELDKGDLPHIGDMIAVCSGLVTIDDESDIIRLVHYTTQEYFQRTQEHWFPNAELDITTICTIYLSFSVFENGFCETDESFEERLRTSQLCRIYVMELCPEFGL